MSAANEQPNAVCPWCETTTPYSTAVKTGTTPREGDYSVCAYCHRLAIYTAELALRLPRPAELEAFRAEYPKAVAIATASQPE